MKKNIIFILVLAVCLTLAGCGKIHSGSILEDMETASYIGNSQGSGHTIDTDDYENSDVPSSTKRTLLIYMAGTDLESEGGIASEDIIEMAESGFFTDAMNVVICTGGSSYWWNSEIPADTCNVFKIMPGAISHCGKLNGKNMGESSTLTEFLDFGYNNFPADEYSLIFWDHGGGSLLGCCFDENYDNDSLSIPEISESFAASQIIKDGVKFEWVGFDACLMAMIEVADAFVPFANYMIASQEEEIGSGWDYGCLKILSSVACDDGKDTAGCIADFYENSCKSNFLSPNYTISCLDLSLLNDVESSFDSVVGKMYELLTSGHYSDIARIRAAVKTFGNSGYESLYDSVDLYNLVEMLADLGIENISELTDAINEMIPVNRTNIEDAYGVSIYFPYVNKDNIDEWLSRYSGFDFSTSYSEFIVDFSKVLTGSNIAEWNIASVLPASETTSAELYNISVELSPDDIEAYSKGSFSIWENTGEDGDFIMWYKSSDVTLSNDGILSAAYDMRQYVLCFGDVELPCSVMMSEKKGDYESYFTPIFLYDMDDELWFANPIPYYVYFYFDSEHPDGVITGIKKTLDEETLIPSREMPEIETGDLVQTFLFSRQIQVDENGKPLPFEEWGNDYFDMNEEYVGEVTEMSIKRTTLPKSGDYYCVFQVYDTQNISHETDIVALEQ